jgi:hypothetical protein
MYQQLLFGSVIAAARIEAVADIVVGAVDGEVCYRGPQMAIACSRGARGLIVDSPQTPPTGIEFCIGGECAH